MHSLSVKAAQKSSSTAVMIKFKKTIPLFGMRKSMVEDDVEDSDDDNYDLGKVSYFFLKGQFNET